MGVILVLYVKVFPKENLRCVTQGECLCRLVIVPSIKSRAERLQASAIT